jgi:patatin-like phospholipase/acyl hydrolase
MTFQRPVRLFLILVAALPVIGCVTIRKAAPIAPEAVAPIGFPHSVRVVRRTPQIFEERDAPRIPRLASVADGTRLNILALSGGGAGGAFGAGVLVGWSRAGTRPDFQIVTGVSAGALIAPLAFLGPSWDGVLEEAFSGSQTEHLLQRDAMGALFGSSIYRGGPLAALVDHYVTDKLIRAVAAEAAKGRLLLVATTNLDTEQTTIWDLTRIATQGGEPGRQLFRDVLIASASVPGIFPPVLIRVEESGKQFDELHVDGGTTASFFIGPDIAEFVPNASTTLRGGNLYVILNEQLGATTKTTPIRTLAIFKRAIAAGIQ